MTIIKYNEAHVVQGYPSNLSPTTSKLEMRTMRANEICERRIKGERRQKNVNKKWNLRQNAQVRKSTLKSVVLSMRVYEGQNSNKHL